MVSVDVSEYQILVRAKRWADALCRLRESDGGPDWQPLYDEMSRSEAEYRNAMGLPLGDWEEELLGG